MAEVPSTRKVQITVPAADTSVTEWLDLQYSPSESIRRLIREAVAREGFVDVANRPVRPPAQPAHVGELLPDEQANDAIDRRSGAAPSAVTTSPASAGPARAEPASAASRSSDHAHDEPDAEQDAPPESAPARRRRERSAPTAASATIDDLLGL